MAFPIAIQFLLASIAIIVAGTFLAKSADKISELTGFGKVFVGGLLLAGATSLPELVVDVKSIKLGLPDLAVGDLLGSSLFNILILAVMDFTFPSAFRRTAFSPAYIHHSLAATLSVLLTATIGIGILAKVPVSFLGVNFFGWATLAFYFFGLRLIFIEDHTLKQPVIGAVAERTTKANWRAEKKALGSAIGVYLVCTLIILLSAPYLVHAADKIALELNIGHTFVGTTLVALTTSLPELVATYAAFRVGAPDLALGNIFGSNAFNMIIFVPLDAIHTGDLFQDVNSTHGLTAFSVITTMSIAIMGQLYRKKDRAYFSEPSSELIVVIVLALLFLLAKVSI